MKIPFIIFQFILFTSLEGTPASPKNIPIVVMFVPLFLIQGATVLFVTFISVAMSFSWIYSVGGPYGKSFARLLARVFLRLYQSCKRFLEKSVLFICSVGRYFASSTARIFLRIFQHCKRLLGCWSVDEEQSRLYTGEATGYNTFAPEVVTKIPESDLVDEVCRLKAALSEQTDNSQQENNLCKVCFEDPVNVVLIPCRHHVLCSTCCKKCETCPICRVLITHRMPVYNV
ncbi:unnamed protein product [Eruca vesicaria subsp. sativa]|uniref:RING-type domain-containing protein n=1 Tax=Eruca vesicaria subsp. sativa TaxID=29727 RepID=A0ABC8JPY2_ERUVS|nr:unnamed protein product [Eruca vesicaria subsp. sativa]